MDTSPEDARAAAAAMIPPPMAKLSWSRPGRDSGEELRNPFKGWKWDWRGGWHWGGELRLGGAGVGGGVEGRFGVWSGGRVVWRLGFS